MARDQRPRKKSVTRYFTQDGKEVRKGTPGAVKKVVKTDTYYAFLRVDGILKAIPLNTRDEGEAWTKFNKLRKEAAERAAGIRDDFTDHAGQPINEHVEAWLESVRAGGRVPRDLDLVVGRLRILFTEAGITKITHLDRDRINQALVCLQRDRDGRRGISAQTRNHYVAHVRQFSRWLHTNGRLKSDPLLALRKVNVALDRRHDRRCPTDDEIGRLMASLQTASAPSRNGMTGPQRALGYRVAMATGYRAEELRSLSRESFDLEKGTVSVRAGYSKRRRKDTQHLPGWLVGELREWFAMGVECWNRFPAQFPGRILKADLKAAGVAWEIQTEDGPLFLDFHSLRVWYITWAASLPGISPKTLMEMARHSDPRLTLAVYAKSKDAEVKAAVAQLPRPGCRAANVAPETVPHAGDSSALDAGAPMNRLINYSNGTEKKASEKG